MGGSQTILKKSNEQLIMQSFSKAIDLSIIDVKEIAKIIIKKGEGN